MRLVGLIPTIFLPGLLKQRKTIEGGELFYYESFISFSSAIFIPSGRVASLSELLWIVGVNDFVLKFVSVIIKIFVILLPSTILQHRKRVSVVCLFFREKQVKKKLNTLLGDACQSFDVRWIEFKPDTGSILVSTLRILQR